MFENLKNLKVYEAGKPIELVVREYGIDSKDIIKLASNENPYGPSKKVIEAVKNNLSLMNRYVDDSYYELKNALSAYLNVKENNLIIGAGSDQVLEFITRAVNPKKVLMAGITFAMYEIYSKQVAAEVIRTKSNFHNIDEFFDLYKKENPELIFLCVPNNPLGESITYKEVLEFVDNVDSLVVVDGAYQEFASYKDNNMKINVNELIERDNVLYTGTFSKAFGLGGMRVGYGVANNFIIENLHKLRPPFNITNLSLVAAVNALDDIEWMKMGVIENFKQMDRYIEFANKYGFDYIDSYTNFIVLYIKDSTRITTELLKRGIIVRDMSSYGFDAIRVTIGTKEQNDIFFEKLEEII